MDIVREQLSVDGKRAVLAGAIPRGQADQFDDLSELASLATTAGAIVVDRFQQKLNYVKPSTFIGQGKAKMLWDRVEEHEADVVIFDNDLSPGQIRELEKIIEVQIIDRSELILDIFSSRAQTRQAKLQVELAQLEYTYPRLTRMWSHLDTITAGAASGGVGTRGTGEKQLEIDRRLVSKRITELKRELDVIDKRKMREISGRKGILKVCIVGYTNAGKSTLMNALTDAGVLVEDKLFATLDTRTKKWRLAGSAEVLLSDTVGFVKRLPHHLVASFKATLEEAVHADLLLHVVDASNENLSVHIKSVEHVLKEIGCKDKKVITILNKIDDLPKTGQLEILSTIYPDAICASAKRQLGITEIKDIVLDFYKGADSRITVHCCVSDGKIQSFLQGSSDIINTEYKDHEVIINTVIGKKQLVQLKKLKPQKLIFND